MPVTWIVEKRSYMGAGKKIPKLNSYEEMAEFWDSHSLADYWDQTEPVEEFKISEQARRRYLVSLDKELVERVRKIARVRGLSTESLVNLLLEQRLQEIERK